MKTRPNSKTKDIQGIKAGTLLVAQPFWPEGIYEHSAILLIDHNSQYTTGLLLNKTSRLNISDVIPDLAIEKPLSFGGPADMKTINYLHTHADIPNAISIGKNLFWGGDFECMKEMLLTQCADADEVKFYAGLTYWYSGHLDYEIKTNKWWVADIQAREVFTIPDKDLWSVKVLSQGHIYGLFQEVPDPSFN